VRSGVANAAGVRDGSAGDPGGAGSRSYFCAGATVARSGAVGPTGGADRAISGPAAGANSGCGNLPNDIPAAAQWADEHHYLTGQALANAIGEDQLPWDPSVQALLPFPPVMDMMNSDMNWTTQLGNAFLAQPQDVMDTVEPQRGIARRFGYLTSNGESAGRGGFHPSTGGAMPGMRTPRGRTGIEAKSVLGRAANSRGDRPRKWTLPSLWEPAQSGFEANRPFSRRGNRYARRPHPQ